MTAADTSLLADSPSSRLLPNIGGGRANQHRDGRKHGLIGGIAVASRPNQWVKNAAVLLAPAAAVATLDRHAIFAAAGATAAFCIASSSVYLLNDTVDRDQDRLHPRKRDRPIASGAVSPGQALAAAAVAATTALGIGLLISPAVAAILAVYLVSSAAYSLGLKRTAFLDVAVLAAGLVLRVLAGVAAVGLVTPMLLLVATFSGAAFLAFGKRRAELSLLGAEAPVHRAALAGYRLPVLDSAIEGGRGERRLTEPKRRLPISRTRRVLRGAVRLLKYMGILAGVAAVAALGQRLGVDSLVAVPVACLVGLGVLYASRRRVSPRHGLRTVATLVVVPLVASIAWSYTGYLTAAGAATPSVRTSDWMRDHGMSPIVDRLEQYVYSGRGPGNGPIATAQLPIVTSAVGGRGVFAAADAKTSLPQLLPRVGGLLDHRLSGEGRWVPSARTVAGGPVTYTTFLRPDRDHANVVASAVWLDPNRTRLTYVPGIKESHGTSWAWGSGIPLTERPRLVAAFNGGFMFKDTPSGEFTEGRTPYPLTGGQASLVIYKDGRVQVGAWGSDVFMTPSVVSVRQNLELLVDGGKPVSGIATSNGKEWGKKLWQLQYTNRSGVGMTRSGALVYVAGANLSTRTLAQALAQVGSVRAMELDIHASNPTFNFFTPGPGSDGVVGSKLYPAMRSRSDRFLAPDQRDFFAVTLTAPVTP